MRCFRHIHTHRTFFKQYWLIAICVLLLAGWSYRNLVSHLEVIIRNPVELPVSLSFFPQSVGDWVGRNVPIPEHVQRVAGNDDFLNRLYVNSSANQWASVYIAYSGQPRTMLGHRPQVCYVAAGWIHESTETSSFISSTGRNVPCLIHRFQRPNPSHEQIIVLSFYILNGQITCNESGFSGVGWRTPNIAGDPARYVAQVQISSVLENSVRDAATDITEVILDFFPNAADSVKSEYVGTAGSI